MLAHNYNDKCLQVPLRLRLNTQVRSCSHSICITHRVAQVVDTRNAIKMHGATWRVNETNEISAWKAEEQPNRNIGRQSNWIRRGIHADWWNLRPFDFESPHYLWPSGWAGGMQFVSSEKLFCGLGAVERTSHQVLSTCGMWCCFCLNENINRFWVATLPLAIWVGWGHAICEL